jgi:hypothetical protein
VGVHTQEENRVRSSNDVRQVPRNLPEVTALVSWAVLLLEHACLHSNKAADKRTARLGQMERRGSYHVQCKFIIHSIFFK